MREPVIERDEVVALLFSVNDSTATLGRIEEFLREDDDEEEQDD